MSLVNPLRCSLFLRCVKESIYNVINMGTGCWIVPLFLENFSTRLATKSINYAVPSIDVDWIIFGSHLHLLVYK